MPNNPIHPPTYNEALNVSKETNKCQSNDLISLLKQKTYEANRVENEKKDYYRQRFINLFKTNNPITKELFVDIANTGKSNAQFYCFTTRVGSSIYYGAKEITLSYNEIDQKNHITYNIQSSKYSSSLISVYDHSSSEKAYNRQINVNISWKIIETIIKEEIQKLGLTPVMCDHKIVVSW